MPVSHREGDLFAQKDINVFLHQGNFRGTLFFRTSSGIAAQVEKLYPEAADADLGPYDESKLGTFTMGKGRDNKVVINMYCQNIQETSYDAMYKILSAVESRIRAFNEKNPHEKKVLGIPYGMGASIATGRWSIVEAVVRAVFDKSPVKLIIVQFPGGKEPTQ